ncbi:class B sortase [Viridibacillus sp. YIM B01967]|uniref:Class B sortase n=1 Tax=Viridibacillus soli TaxID=2798301 RepID=A0ABS1HD72_9BACL|nr:class B sortase [Viridibacillus soli]MBK3497359.1 class B sortase [Viridibacillus soli]
MEGTKKKIKKKKTVLQRVLTIVYLAIFLYSAYELGSLFKEYYDNRKVIAEAQELYVAPISETAEISANDGGIRAQFKKLLDINSELVGWLTVDDTHIDYPILQAENNDFYLNHNYKKESNLAGSIFMDYRNRIEENDKNTILYGHRMKDGTMFTQLKKYLEQDFADAHPKFYYDTLYEGYEIEVFAAYLTTTDFYYIETDFDNDDEFLDLVKNMREKSDVQTSVKVDAKDQILTLSTCDYGPGENRGRLVVHGKIVERK